MRQELRNTRRLTEVRAPTGMFSNAQWPSWQAYSNGGPSIEVMGAEAVHGASHPVASTTFVAREW